MPLKLWDARGLAASVALLPMLHAPAVHAYTINCDTEAVSGDCACTAAAANCILSVTTKSIMTFIATQVPGKKTTVQCYGACSITDFYFNGEVQNFFICASSASCAIIDFV